MSLTLLKRDVKAYYRLWLGILALLTMYFVIVIGMYDPENTDLVARLAAMKLSPEMLRAFGFSVTLPGLTGFMSGYLYGFLMLAFPLVYSCFLGNRLVAALVDRGSMAAILSSPVSRVKVALTQGFYLIISLLALVAAISAVGLVYSAGRFPGLLDVPAFLRLNLHLFLAQAAVSGVCFFASCLFSLSARSLALGSGLGALFLVAQMLVNVGREMNWLRYLTLFSFFRPADIAAGRGTGVSPYILVAAALLLYAGGVWVFNKKDLPV